MDTKFTEKLPKDYSNAAQCDMSYPPLRAKDCRHGALYGVPHPMLRAVDIQSIEEMHKSIERELAAIQEKFLENFKVASLDDLESAENTDKPVLYLPTPADVEVIRDSISGISYSKGERCLLQSKELAIIKDFDLHLPYEINPAGMFAEATADITAQQKVSTVVVLGFSRHLVARYHVGVAKDQNYLGTSCRFSANYYAYTTIPNA